VYSDKGRRAEWELRDILEARGCYVVRSAASRNIDLIAIEPNGATVGYEVKSTSSPRLSLNNSYARSQLSEHFALSRKIAVYYAVRFTVERSPLWRLFAVREGMPLVLKPFDEDAIPLG